MKSIELLNMNLLRGVFLIIVLVLGTTVNTTYSKRLLNLIKENDYIKHIVLIWIIYFSIDYSDDKLQDPLKTFKQTLLIWILYLVISKQKPVFIVFNILLLSIIYVLNQSKEYNESQQTDMSTIESEHSQTIDLYIRYLLYLLVVSIIVGVYDYYSYKKITKRDQFKLINFVFGPKI